MARTAAANFSGGLQFPYATAATDLFKKEDVQTLAVAVDTHDHTSGKGLALAAGSIPAGLITSAMIADGTIATADIAANAVSQYAVNVKNPPGATNTTSTSFVTIPNLDVAITTGGGFLLVMASISWSNTAGAQANFGLTLDGGADVVIGFPSTLTSGNAVATSFIYLFQGVSTGAHTVHMRWATTSGTLALTGATTSITVLELKK